MIIDENTTIGTTEIEPEDRLKSSIKDNMVIGFDTSGELNCTVEIDRIAMLKIMGVWGWALTECPNRKVKHLMNHGKSKRVRFKNFKRATQLIAKKWRRLKND